MANVAQGFSQLAVRASHEETACDMGGESDHACDTFAGDALESEEQTCLNFGGWLSGGLTLNADGNNSGNGNAPYGYNNISDGAVLNQGWLFLEKEASADGIDWGFHIDYVFGTDGPDNQAFADQTWDFGWNSSRDYGSAIPQLYGDLKMNDLLIRVGYFLTPIGYESVQAPLNFFYSHSYTFYFSEPNTHSGFLATYDLNDRVTLQGGWTMGMDGSFANDLNASTFLGGVGLSLNDDTSLTWTFVAGDWGDGTGRNGVPGNEGDIYIHSIILEHSISDRLTYVFHNDLGVNSNQASSPDAHWYAFVQYLAYEISDHVQIGTRLEWFRDDGGVRLVSGATNEGDYYEATLGLNWSNGQRLILRPEIRWDWSGGAGQPFDNGTSDEFFTYAISGIFTF